MSTVSSAWSAQQQNEKKKKKQVPDVVAINSSYSSSPMDRRDVQFWRHILGIDLEWLKRA